MMARRIVSKLVNVAVFIAGRNFTWFTFTDSDDLHCRNCQDNWAHSMGPQRSPLSRVVVVVVVDIDAQAARDSTASDTGEWATRLGAKSAGVYDIAQYMQSYMFVLNVK